MEYLLLFCREIFFLMVSLLMWQCLLLTVPMRLLMSVAVMNHGPAALGLVHLLKLESTGFPIY